MDRGFRRGFTAAEKTELWDRWQRGESLKAIGRAFGKPSSSIYFQVSPFGGIRPAPRRRSRLALTLAERVRRYRALEAWKRAMWETGCKLPTQVTDGLSRCFCGAQIKIKNVEHHVYAAHLMPLERESA
jgi:hypothetical protein